MPASNEKAAPPVLIRNARLIDGVRDTAQENMSILIEGDRIARVVPSREDPADLSGYEVVEGAGLTVLPGFIDTHGHFESWMGQILLNHGVTTLVDVGNISPLEWVLAQREAVRHGLVTGPRLMSFGSCIVGDPAPNREFRLAGYPVVASADEARRVVEREIELGVDGVKAYCNLTDEAMAAITETAHAADLPVLAHTNKNAVTAARLGIDGIAHGSGIKYAASDRGRDLAAIGADAPYASAPAAITAWNWIDRSRTTEVLSELVELGVYLEPDVVHTGGRALHKNAPQYRDEDIRFFSRSDVQYIPEDYRLTVLEYAHWDHMSAEDFALAQRGFGRYMELIAEFHSLGGTVLAASGLSINPAGIGLHRELEVLVGLGLSPMEALKGCTSYAAEFLRQADHIGTVESGKLADVLVVQGNPLVDIAATQRIAAVFARGDRVDLGYSAWYRNPMPAPPFVWAAHGNPRPEIDSISPALCVIDTPLQLRVQGSGFIADSRLLIDGEIMPTELDSQSGELVVDVRPGLIGLGTYQAVVMNPKPAPAGQVSNTFYLYGSPALPTKSFP